MTISHKITATLGALALAAFLAAGMAGCGSKKTDGARHLERGEAEQLIASQAGRSTGAMGAEMITDPVKLAALGDAKAARNDMASALFLYTRAQALDKDKKLGPGLRAKIASVYLRGRNFAQAEGIFSELLAKQPGNARYLQGRGLARLGQSKLPQAAEDLVAAVKKDPKLWKAFNGLGIIYNQERRHDLAVQAFSQAITVQPKVAQLYNNLGMAYLMKKDLAKAEHSFRYALKLKRNYKRAANNLGLVYARQKKYSKARRAFERGAGRPEAHNNVGCFMAWEGKHEEAAEEFREALRAKPSYYALAGRHLDQLSGRASTTGSPSSDEPIGAPPLVGTPASPRSTTDVLSATTVAFTPNTPWSPAPLKKAPAPKAVPAPKKAAKPTVAPAPKVIPAPKKAAKPPVATVRAKATPAAPPKPKPAKPSPIPAPKKSGDEDEKVESGFGWGQKKSGFDQGSGTSLRDDM